MRLQVRPLQRTILRAASSNITKTDELARQKLMRDRPGTQACADTINLTDEDVRALTDRWEVVYSYDAH